MKPRLNWDAISRTVRTHGVWYITLLVACAFTGGLSAGQLVWIRPGRHIPIGLAIYSLGCAVLGVAIFGYLLTRAIRQNNVQ